MWYLKFSEVSWKNGVKMPEVMVCCRGEWKNELSSSHKAEGATVWNIGTWGWGGGRDEVYILFPGVPSRDLSVSPAAL